MSDQDQGDEGPGRRRFLTVLSVAGSAAIGGLLAVPGAAYVMDPLLRRRGAAGGWLDVGSVDSVREDAPVMLPVIGDLEDAWTRAPRQVLGNVYVQKRGDDLLVLTAECPHLGCKIAYDEGRSRFACPCHESAFGLDGEVRGGPSPRGMDELEHRIRDGRIEVRFVRYRSQTSDQTPVG
jgi:Rieske Fe-S protein